MFALDDQDTNEQKMLEYADSIGVKITWLEEVAELSCG